jgi:pimeloyl-ACP methyl ester carboxylesterase
MKPMKDVIVLLPGILGSVLTRNGKDVWALSGGAIVGGLLSLGGSIKDLALVDQSTDPDKAADGIVATRLLDDVHLIPGLWKIDGYTKVAKAIKGEFDVEEGRNFFTFPYDWRRDNRVAARQLAKKAEDWLGKWRAHPKGAKDAKLILIGHSMGGLVSRYFLEVLDGWRNTRRLITFGTPYRGSLNALNTLANGLKVGVGPLKVDLSPLAQSLPSLHQLLPIYPCYDDGGPDLRRCYEVDVPNLDRAKAQAANEFHREIERKVEDHVKTNEYLQNRYSIHPIVGRKQQTLQSGRRKGNAVEMFATYKGEDMEGDGTVPRVSATPIEVKKEEGAIFAAELHASLQNADSALLNVAGILGALDTEVFEIAEGEPGAALRLVAEDAYAAGAPIAMTVAPAEDWVDLEARVVNVSSKETVHTVLLPAAGAAPRTVAFPPLQAGTYRVTVEGDGAQPVNDVFVVM